MADLFDCEVELTPMGGRAFLLSFFLSSASLSVTVPAARAQSPLGEEFRVNTTTGSGAYVASAAADGLGNFVVVWASQGRDGDREGIQGQRYDSVGQPLLGEFRVNTYTSYRQVDPEVAVAANGDFVVVWTNGVDSFYGPDGSSTSISAQRFDAEGRTLGGELQVNTYTTGPQFSPTVAADAGGGFVVVWTSDGPSAYSSIVSGQRFDAAGNALGDELQISSSTTTEEIGPALAADAGGGFVVVWTHYDRSDFSRNVHGRRFDAGGVALGNEFQVNSTTLRSHLPAVAVDADGNVVVVWSTFSGGSFVLARRYDSAGGALGEELQVNSTTAESFRPAVATEPDGGFVVAWISASGGYAYDEQYIHGRRFDSAGGPLGTELRVDSVPGRYPTGSSVATAPAGNFMVVWSAYPEDGSFPHHVWGRVYCPDQDADSVCDDVDACVGDDLSGDDDLDSICNDLDPCPGDAGPECIFTNGFESGDTSAWM